VIAYNRRNKQILADIVKTAEARQPAQLALEGFKPDIAAVAAQTTQFACEQTIDIPRILVVPKGAVQSGFRPFAISLDSFNFPPVSEDLRVQFLRTGEGMAVTLARGLNEEPRMRELHRPSPDGFQRYFLR